MAFANFKAATQAESPNYLAAHVADEKRKAEQEMQAAALRSQNMIGGGMLYNQAMGDKSPIADWMSSKLGGSTPTVPMDPMSISGDMANPMLPPVVAPDAGAMINPNLFPGGGSVAPMAGREAAMINPNLFPGGGSLSAAAAPTEAALAQSLAAPATEAVVADTALAGATGAGASGMAAVLPWAGGAMLADKLLFGGKGMDALTGGGGQGGGGGFDIFDTEIYEDIAGAAFGKGWLWS